MPYDATSETTAWLERVLMSPRPAVRRRAVELLEYVECPRRDAWLEAAERDGDPRVSVTAVLVGIQLKARRAYRVLELMESEVGEGARSSPDLGWEWEYEVKVCEAEDIPAIGHLVWMREEDDAAAKSIAVIRRYAGMPHPADAIPIIVAKRLVTAYTRHPRNRSEASRWARDGRPRYKEP